MSNYYPWYNQDADYQTNAKSYMDYLARTNKFMGVLVEDYEVFKELLLEEFKQFQQDTSKTIDQFNDRLDNIKQEMIDFFNQWLEDGVLDQVINQDILNRKPDRTEMTALFNQVDERMTDNLSNLNTRAINVLHAPEGLDSAVGDGVTDDAPALNALINYLGEQGGGELIFPNQTYALSSPLMINHDRVLLSGKRAELITTQAFDVTIHKGIIESLTMKNGGQKRRSLQEVIISGFVINGESKPINGIALSGFTRGCVVENNYIHDCFNGIAISGSWSSCVRNNLVYNCQLAGLLLGNAYDIIISSQMTYTDNGLVTTLPQEGYEYSNGNVSVQCNAMEITHNTLRSNKNNLMVHFGNANVFTNNTLENASNANMIISALESGSFIGNYMEASIGSVFGRASSGAIRNTVWHGNFYHNERFFFLGFINNDFSKNEIIGNAETVYHSFQRVNGNISQLPNPSFKADSSPLRADYRSQRDNTVNDDVLSHGGKLSTALEDTKLINGLELGDYTTDPALLKPTPDFMGYQLTKAKQIGQTPGVVATLSRTGLVIVEGASVSNTNERFIDLVLVISYGSSTVVSSQTRGSNMATRSYSVNNDDLRVSFSNNTYTVRSSVIGY